MRFFDVHNHIFTSGDIPIQTLLSKPVTLIVPFLHKDIPFLKSDDRAREFFRLFESEMSEIAEQLVTNVTTIAEKSTEYSDNDNGITKDDTLVLTPLTIYFDREEASNKRIRTQCTNIQKAISDVKKSIAHWNDDRNPWKTVKILPFLGLGPDYKWESGGANNNSDWSDAEDLLKMVSPVEGSIESVEDGTFIGVKVYPPLGVKIDGDGAMKIWEECEKRNIPITVHSSGGGYIGMGISSREASSLSDPHRWEKVLKKHPFLKINFGHLGGLESGRVDTIFEFMEKYPNVYSDISFDLENENKLYHIIRKEHDKPLSNGDTVADRLLFGSDFYMSELRASGYEQLVLPFAKKLKRAGLFTIFEKMSMINPERFLTK